MTRLTRLLAVAVVSGAAPFTFAAVASAEPGAPNPNPNALVNKDTACAAILLHNQAINLHPTPQGIYPFEGVGFTFGCFD